MIGMQAQGYFMIVIIFEWNKRKYFQKCCFPIKEPPIIMSMIDNDLYF